MLLFAFAFIFVCFSFCMLGRLFGRPADENAVEWLLAPANFRGPSGKENYAGKVVLPQACLMDLVQRQAETPYAFKISAHSGVSYTHSGVLDFTADPGTVVIPHWMYDQLSIDRNTAVTVTYTKLPRGKFIRLLPQDPGFLKIDNPKKELEKALRHYQVLSHGDNIELILEDEFKTMFFTVAEIRPAGDGISIIDTDLEVDFLPPAGYEDAIEKEQTALPFVQVVDGPGDVKEIRMREPGLFFGLKSAFPGANANACLQQ